MIIISPNRRFILNDDNDATGSTGGDSASQTDNAESSSASESSATATGDNGDGKTATQASTKKEPTLAEVTQKAFDKAVQKEKDASKPSDAEEEEESTSTVDADKEKSEEEKVESSEEEETDKEETNEDEEEKPVPYERFKEVNKERDEWKAKVAEYEPLAKAQNDLAAFCDSNGITPEQFTEGMQFIALLNSNPIEARKQLEPIWNQLSGLSGDSLPADIQKKLDDGVIDEETAKELARLRGHGKVSEAQQKLNTQKTQQQQQQAHVASITNAVVSWDKSKRATDPDFKPKAQGAKDGKYEVFSDRLYRLMAGQNFPKDAAAAVQLAEEAYKQANEFFGQFTKKPVAKQKINSSKSSTGSTKAQPKNMQEAVNQMLKEKHGVEVG